MGELEDPPTPSPQWSEPTDPPQAVEPGARANATPPSPDVRTPRPTAVELLLLAVLFVLLGFQLYVLVLNLRLPHTPAL